MTLEATFKELSEELSEIENGTRQSDTVTSTYTRGSQAVLPLEQSILQYLAGNKEIVYKSS